MTFDQCVQKIRDEKRVLFIGTPIYRGYHEDYHRSMMATLLRCLELELPILIARPDPLTIVDLGRNYIIDDANKDARVTDVMQIDSDMGWEPDDLITLWANDKEFVAAVGRKRNALLNADINGWAQRPLMDDQGKARFPVDMSDGYIRFEGVGAAFIRLRMAAVRKMIEAYPELIGRVKHVTPAGIVETMLLPHLFGAGIFDGSWLTEDFAFCKRWTDLGGEIWVDPTIKLRHHGENCWEGSLIEAFKKKEKPYVAARDVQPA